ncbi:MAG: hypothetical protein ACK5AZ_26935 [Bryobacteraceae bacterium]
MTGGSGVKPGFGPHQEVMAATRAAGPGEARVVEARDPRTVAFFFALVL